ncbi:MAG: hypothetical protein ACRYGR_10150 [Janthinobacterium lividum]
MSEAYDFALFPDTNDLAVIKGTNGKYGLTIVNDAQKVRQQIWITLTIFYGEWFLDTSIGIPYFTDVLVKNAVGTKVSSILRAAIFSVPSVTQVKTLTLNISSKRQLTVSYSVVTSLGIVDGLVPLSTGA